MIVPALIPQSKKAFEDMINNATMRKLAPIWQFDILNGSLYEADSWSDPVIVGLQPSLPDFELHLMINDPLPIVDLWLRHVQTVKRVIFHAEISQDLQRLVTEFRKRNLEVGIALNPETSLDDIESLTEHIDLVLIMGVHPGRGGQDFLGEPILHKIEEAARRFPHLIIAVDGGVKPKNAKEIITAGAHQLCIGSGLWKTHNKEALFTSLKNL